MFMAKKGNVTPLEGNYKGSLRQASDELYQATLKGGGASQSRQHRFKQAGTQVLGEKSTFAKLRNGRS